MRIAVIPAILLTFVACGGSGSSGPTEARMNFTNAGLRSATGAVTLTIPTGGKVHFFNQDTVNHQASSNCAELTEAAPLAPGKDEVMPVLNNPTNCSITDSLNPSNQSFNAFVTVAAPAAIGGGGGGSGY
jgi:hypothetical protein